jgi:type I restriction enzyme S subunit
VRNCGRFCLLTDPFIIRSQADILEAQVAAVHRQLEQVDQAVLARAFRGELVPQDPNDEPASVLLERIRKEREGKRGETHTRQVRLPGT